MAASIARASNAIDLQYAVCRFGWRLRCVFFGLREKTANQTYMLFSFEGEME